jgi:hypothetical protein
VRAPRAAGFALAAAGLLAALAYFDRFSAPIPGAGWTIMGLYWPGQWAIAASVATAPRPGNGMLAGR